MGDPVLFLVKGRGTFDSLEQFQVFTVNVHLISFLDCVLETDAFIEVNGVEFIETLALDLHHLVEHDLVVGLDSFYLLSFVFVVVFGDGVSWSPRLFAVDSGLCKFDFVF